MEEEDGYLTGEPDPFISSAEAITVCPVEERDESEDIPPLNGSVDSTEVFEEDKQGMLLTGERLDAPISVATVDPRVALKGRLELYML